MSGGWGGHAVASASGGTRGLSSVKCNPRGAPPRIFAVGVSASAFLCRTMAPQRSEEGVRCGAPGEALSCVARGCHTPRRTGTGCTRPTCPPSPAPVPALAAPLPTSPGLLAILLSHPVAAQVNMPFIGRGDLAPRADGAVDVYVSVYVDRMLKIDDKEYEYEVRLRGGWAGTYMMAGDASGKGAEGVSG